MRASDSPWSCRRTRRDALADGPLKFRAQASHGILRPRLAVHRPPFALTPPGQSADFNVNLVNLQAPGLQFAQFLGSKRKPFVVGLLQLVRVGGYRTQQRPLLAA